MEPSRWEQICAIFGTAVELPPEQRQGFLDERCGGDTTMRAEVEGLLSQDTSCAGSSGFLEPSAVNVRTEMGLEPATDPRIGATLGAYRVDSLIGQGGMGRVYRAQRGDDFSRTVALKVLKRGMDTEEIVARFRREVQTQATLGEHPNIAGLIDAGTTEDGLPYFVMEYVEGERIDKYCSDNHLDLDQRLQVFLGVCDAVRFAHRHAVIHRDLKPSNILVGSDGSVKLIDFGIVKLIGEASGDTTHLGDRALTPDYASPEQLTGEPTTTATDVYALGVILYELLTSRRMRTSKGTSFADLVGSVTSKVPSRPSEVSGDRRLRGDLDTIVMKATSIEPSRRYDTVESLEADLRRYRAGMPVNARPDTFAYRWGKFVRRNATAVILAGAVLLTLVAGVIGTTTQWLRAEDNLAAAKENLERAEYQKQRRDVNFARLQRAVDSMLTRVGKEVLVDVPRMELVRKQLFREALEYYESFREESVDDPDILAETGRAHIRMGTIHMWLREMPEGRAALETALRILTDLTRQFPERTMYQVDRAMAHQHLARLLEVQQRPAEAIPHVRQAIELQEAALQAPPDRDGVLVELAASYRLLGSLYELSDAPLKAEPTYQKALEIYDRVSDDWEWSTNAQLERTRCLEMLAERVRKRDPDQARVLLAEVLDNLRNFAAANPDDLDYRLDLARVHALLGRFPPGGKTTPVEHFEESIKILEQITLEYPRVPDYLEKLAGAYGDLGIVLDMNRRSAEAAVKFRRQVETLERMVSEFPQSSETQRMLGYAYHNLAVFENRQNNPETSKQLHEKALRLRLDLADKNPNYAPLRYEVVRTLVVLGGVQANLDEVEEAKAAFRRCLSMMQGLVEADPDNLEYHNQLANVHSRLADAYVDENDPEARRQLHQAAQILEKVVAQAPNHPRYLIQMAIISNHAGKIALRFGEYMEAEQAYRRAAQALSQRLALDPGNPAYRVHFSVALNQVGHALLAQGLFDEAATEYQQAFTIRDQLYQGMSEDRDLRHKLARSCALLSQYHATWAQPNARDLDKALRLAERAIELNPESTSAQFTLGIIRARSGDWQQAREVLRAMTEADGLSDDEEAIALFFLAMAEWHRGAHQPATESFDQANTLLMGRPEPATVKMVREEVSKLIGRPNRR